MLIFYTCANKILEFDPGQCPLEWNQANRLSYCISVYVQL